METVAVIKRNRNENKKREYSRKIKSFKMCGEKLRIMEDTKKGE